MGLKNGIVISPDTLGRERMRPFQQPTKLSERAGVLLGWGSFLSFLVLTAVLKGPETMHQYRQNWRNAAVQECQRTKGRADPSCVAPPKPARLRKPSSAVVWNV